MAKTHRSEEKLSQVQINTMRRLFHIHHVALPDICERYRIDPVGARRIIGKKYVKADVQWNVRYYCLFTGEKLCRDFETFFAARKFAASLTRGDAERWVRVERV